MLEITVIMGPSFSGKSTYQQQLIKQGIPKLVTTTSRPPRDGEQNNLDYRFVSQHQAASELKTKFAIAPRSYHVTNDQVWSYYLYLNHAKINQLKRYHHVSLILDWLGYQELYHWVNKYHPEIKLTGIYLDVPLKKRLERYLNGNRQNEDPKETIRRFYDDEFHAFNSLTNETAQKYHVTITQP